MVELFGGFSAVVIVILLVWTVLWFLLPFVVYGIKNRLDDILAELVKANKIGEKYGRR